jgi:hypothetical protein
MGTHIHVYEYVCYEKACLKLYLLKITRCKKAHLLCWFEVVHAACEEGGLSHKRAHILLLLPVELGLLARQECVNEHRALLPVPRAFRLVQT